MAIKMVREPSDTPNITNIDDFVGLRYAYGDQSGFCSGKGSEISYSISGSSFTVLSGRLVIQGVECDIDANGVSIRVDNVASKRYHTVYAQVSLSTMLVSILEVTDTAGFPTVNAGDDLNVVTMGTARLPLYGFISQSGVISGVEKRVFPIQYAYQQVARLEQGLSNGEVIPKIAQYASSDTSKGTIEERLTKLGFRSGSVGFLGGSGSANYKRQGNYVLVKIGIYSPRWETDSVLFTGGVLCTLPSEYRPLTQIISNIGGIGADAPSLVRVSYSVTLTIGTDGTVRISEPIHYSRIYSEGERCRANSLDVTIGFEAPAIT